MDRFCGANRQDREGAENSLAQKRKPSGRAREREWLIGERLPALYENVTGGLFPKTRGGRGAHFIHVCLRVLGEPGAGVETIKSFVSPPRRRRVNRAAK